MSDGSFEQLPLGLEVVTSNNAEDWEAGVFNDGTPFLTGASLAKVCGVSKGTFNQWLLEFATDPDKPRSKVLRGILQAQGHEGPLYVKTTVNGTEVNAFPEKVSMSFLEYYAFESDQASRETAARNYRMLATRTFRTFIYGLTGYDPNKVALDSWRHFHDRLLLNPVPATHFSVFTEIAGLIVSGIRGGLIMTDETVPDISVGQVWGRHWMASAFDSRYGARARYEHNFPDYFRQAASNPQEPWMYPNDALPEFRRWMNEEYIPNKYPRYIGNKVKQGHLEPEQAMRLIQAYAPVSLPQAGGVARLTDGEP